MICFLYPVITVLTNLDPLFYVLNFFLPPEKETCLALIVATLFLRLFVSAIGTYEFLRFNTLHFFVILSILQTTLACLRSVTENSFLKERLTFKLYTILRIIMKTADYFSRHVVAHLLLFCQISIVSMLWLVLKCWHILPIFITSMFGLTAVSALYVIILNIHCAVEISHSSDKFVQCKKALNHTFNRESGKHYSFLKWSSQRMLPIRFGTQFVIGAKTPISYFEVLMINFTNAVLLINP